MLANSFEEIAPYARDVFFEIIQIINLSIHLVSHILGRVCLRIRMNINRDF